MSAISHPKLRSVHSQWIEHMGQPALLLRDRLLPGTPAVIVPQLVAPLLALCDGTRDAPAIRTAMELWTGIRLDQPTLDRLLSQLDGALMLDNERSARAFQEALEEYRSAPCRPPLLAGGSYPAEPEALALLLDGWLDTAAANGHAPVADHSEIRGLICPHIDYERGGQIYGDLWSRARNAVAEADLFVILGTDHAGGPGELTLTRQPFQTPFGVLATDAEAVETVAEAIGADAAFHSELHHRGEHSIELAAVWLHHLVRDRPVSVVPVLCGSFQPFIAGESHPRDDGRWQGAVSALRGVVSGRRALVVAAADLAHVGPAFGDPAPLQAAEKLELDATDMAMLATLRRGDADGFLGYVAGEGDGRRVCGLPPVYLALQLLGDVEGELVSYSQCPASGGSVVSVAGLILR